MPPASHARPVAERLWKQVDKSGECWTWTGRTFWDGYGAFDIGSRTDGSRRSVRAHRVAWELAHGAVPLGSYVLHHCDNRKCVRVEHLFLGDHQANMDDMWAKGRARSGRPTPEQCARNGEQNGNSRLTAEQVVAIRRRALSETPTAIARDYGVTRTAVSNIAARKTWRHVP